MKKIRVGMKVGSERWGMSHAHPDIWMKPWKGTVLSCDDPRAWHGTYAMNLGRATKEKVQQHLTDLESVGQKPCEEWSDVPVLWDFGDKKKVFWQEKKTLRPYSEDVRKWKQAKEKAEKKW
jgi:hypothetical protein